MNTKLMVPKPGEVRLEEAPVGDPGPREVLIRPLGEMPGAGA